MTINSSLSSNRESSSIVREKQWFILLLCSPTCPPLTRILFEEFFLKLILIILRSVETACGGKKYNCFSVDSYFTSNLSGQVKASRYKVQSKEKISMNLERSELLRNRYYIFCHQIQLVSRRTRAVKQGSTPSMQELARNFESPRFITTSSDHPNNAKPARGPFELMRSTQS